MAAGARGLCHALLLHKPPIIRKKDKRLSSPGGVALGAPSRRCAGVADIEVVVAINQAVVCDAGSACAVTCLASRAPAVCPRARADVGVVMRSTERQLQGGRGRGTSR